MIPTSTRFDQSTMQALLEADPLVADYRQFFALFDWSVVERWQAHQSAFYGSHGHPLTAYLKAFLIPIKEGLTYSTRLRDFLRHRILCWSSTWASSCTWIRRPPTASMSS